MNSIDTFIPTLLPLLESEEGITTSPVATPDAAALEALRALMGGFAAPPAACGSPGTVRDALQRPAAAMPAVLEQLLKSDGLPAALVPLLTNLRTSLQKADPALVAEIKTLLREMVPAQPGFSMKDDDLAGGTGTPSIGVVKTSDAPWLAAVVEAAGGQAVVPAPSVPVSHPVQESTAQAFAGVETPSAPPAALPGNMPADIPTLAHVLLQMLEDTPHQNGVASMVAPLLESTRAEDYSASTPPDRPADTQNLGSAILQSLGHQSVPTPVQRNDQAVSSTGAAERVTEVSNLITQMADRVLVTDPLHGQTQEVRIKIADNIMQGTEVRVWREDGGALRVEFDTTSAYWSRILNDASPLLSQRLNERLPSGTEAQVTVTVQQQGQQPEDGRSRNRQNPWELAQQGQES